MRPETVSAGPDLEAAKSATPYRERERRRRPPRTDDSTVKRDVRLFKRHLSWLVPVFVAVNVLMFIVTMYVNDCPKNYGSGYCTVGFLGRLSFQPMKENPLLGPSSST